MTMLKKEISSLKIFENFSPSQLIEIEPLITLNKFASGESVFNQGDPAKYICVILDGQVDIRFKPDDGELISVARLSREGVFGWSAAFGSGTYTSGAIAITDVKLLCVSGENLKKLNKDNPKTGKLMLDQLAKIVSKRLDRTNAQGRDQVAAMLEHGLKNGIKPLGG
ncbi:MAG: cyclic nucleotide-binding domain-containing protein [Chloroflexota bacterium]